MRHGGDLSDAIAHYGIAAADWLDLSTGINPRPYPFAPPATDTWRRLPSLDAMANLLAAARGAYEVPGELSIAAAPGTQSLIQLLPHLLPEGAVAVVGPTYGPHEATWRQAGRSVEVVTGLAAVGDDIRIAVVTNPNNPDGRMMDRAALIDAACRLAAHGGWLLVDEAFADVDPALSVVPDLAPGLPVIVLRSFGKFYGLAGLRLGFAIGPDAAIASVAARLGEWAVAGPALAIGAAALGDGAWREETRSWIAGAGRALEETLSRNGLEVKGNTGLFCLAATPDAAALHHRLAETGIWCRRFDYAASWLRFGLPGSEEELARLDAALTRIPGRA